MTAVAALVALFGVAVTATLGWLDGVPLITLGVNLWLWSDRGGDEDLD